MSDEHVVLLVTGCPWATVPHCGHTHAVTLLNSTLEEHYEYPFRFFVLTCPPGSGRNPTGTAAASAAITGD
jgi:hypothetical protein